MNIIMILASEASKYDQGIFKYIPPDMREGVFCAIGVFFIFIAPLYCHIKDKKAKRLADDLLHKKYDKENSASNIVEAPKGGDGDNGNMG